MFPTLAHISGICFSEKYLTSYSTPKTGICHFFLPSFSAGETPKRRAGHAVARIFFTARASISPPHVSGGESSTQARDLVWFTHHLCLKLSLPWFSPGELEKSCDYPTHHLTSFTTLASISVPAVSTGRRVPNKCDGRVPPTPPPTPTQACHVVNRHRRPLSPRGGGCISESTEPILTRFGMHTTHFLGVFMLNRRSSSLAPGGCHGLLLKY